MYAWPRLGWYNTILTAPHIHVCPSIGPKSPLVLEFDAAIYGLLRLELCFGEWLRDIEHLHGPNMDVWERVGWYNAVLMAPHTHTYPRIGPKSPLDLETAAAIYGLLRLKWYLEILFSAIGYLHGPNMDVWGRVRWCNTVLTAPHTHTCPNIGPKLPIDLEKTKAIYGLMRLDWCLETWISAFEYFLCTKHVCLTSVGVI